MKNYFAFDTHNSSKSMDKMIDFFYQAPTKMKVDKSILGLLIIASAIHDNRNIYSLLETLTDLQYDIRCELSDVVKITLVYKNAFMYIYNNTARTWEE